MCGIFCYLFQSQQCIVFDEVFKGVEEQLRNRGPDCMKRVNKSLSARISAEIIGCTLHLRSFQVVEQPLWHLDGSFLLWNGEIFAGIQVAEEENDGEVLFKLLLKCKNDVELLSTISEVRGPWAIIFWQASTKRLWFGRDVFGRRSLLWQYNSDSLQLDRGFALSSVSVRPSSNQVQTWHWKEVPFSGIFSLVLCDKTENSLKLFPWSHRMIHSDNSIDSDDVVKYLISPISIQTPILSELECMLPTENDVHTLYEDILQCIPRLPRIDGTEMCSVFISSKMNKFEDVVTKFEDTLLKSIERRSLNKPQLCQHCILLNSKVGLSSSAQNICSHSKLAVLFSGGLDSSVLAAIAHKCLPVDEPIDLLNVSFWRNKECVADQAPDRISGCTAYEELKNIAPNRKWNFVKINVSKEEMENECERNIADLIYPLSTVLDKDIGCALWFAARGKGILSSSHYTTPARVLLTGMGADEQLAGYARHRICFKRNGWQGVLKELSMEMNRIASRNMGRDDRIISSHGREPRFPYLDEELVSFLNGLPIWYKTNLNLPQGLGDKFLLRLLAYRLGLRAPTVLAKRAIQFGSKIAKMDNGHKGTDICAQLQEKQK